MIYVVLAAAILAVAKAAQFDFQNTVLQPLTQMSRRHGMFAPDDTPASGPPGNGESYIHLDVSFKRNMDQPQKPAAIQMIIFHNSELENVHKAAEQSRFCCTHKQAAMKEYGCYVAGQFVSTYQPLYKIDVPLSNNGSAVSRQGNFKITQTGLHYLMYSSCQPDAGDVFIDGHNIWMNPYGHLPGELYFNMPFFFWMTILHLVAILLWGALLIRFREELLPVQGHIAGVLLLAMLEVQLWYLHYNAFNDHGVRPSALTIAAILSSTVKKTVSRLLVLAVCMGYGIVKPNLGNRAWQIVGFGVIYCVFSTVLDVVKTLSHDTDYSGGFFVLVIIPVAVLDSVFYLWTFMSLYDVVAQLEERRQTVKLQLYRRFIWVLGVCMVLSCGWVLYQMYFLYGNMFPFAWQTAWMFDAYWYVLSFAILLAIMFLWAPNENSKRYAYYEENVNTDEGTGLELETQENTLGPSFSIDDDEDEEGGMMEGSMMEAGMMETGVAETKLDFPLDENLDKGPAADLPEEDTLEAFSEEETSKLA